MQTDLQIHYMDTEMKQMEISREAHKALKLEAADRDMPMKYLAQDIIENWLDSHRPGWRAEQKTEDETKE